MTSGTSAYRIYRSKTRSRTLELSVTSQHPMAVSISYSPNLAKQSQLWSGTER